MQEDVCMLYANTTTILHKGLEHLPILVSAGRVRVCSGTSPLWITDTKG